MKIINHLVKSIRDASIYNPEIAAPPACILWPDRDRQWEAVMGRLQAELPELLVLGEYDPEQKSRKCGPAIWLRCVLGGTVPEVELPQGVTRSGRNWGKLLWPWPWSIKVDIQFYSDARDTLFKAMVE